MRSFFPSRAAPLPWLAALAPVALLALLPVLFIGRTPFAYVELVTLDALRQDVAGLVRHRLEGAHTPTWFLLLKLLGLAEAPPWALRLPSVVAHVGAALLGALAGQRLVGQRLAGRGGLLLAGALVALHPLLLELANLARPYAALAAASLWLLLSSAALADRPRLAVAALAGRLPGGPLRTRLRWLWASALLAPLVAASLLPLGLLVWLALDLALLLWLLRPARRGGAGARSRRARRRFLGRFLLARLAPLLLVGAGYLALFAVIGRMAGNYWTRPFDWEAVVQALGITHAWQPMVDSQRFLPGLGKAFLGAAILLLALFGLRRAPRRTALVLAVALAAGLPLLLMAISLHTSLLVPRYFSPAAVGVALLAGVGAAALGRHWAGRAAVALVLLLAVLQGLDALSGDRGRPRIETVAAWLAEADGRPGEEAVVTNLETNIFALNHYLMRWGSPRVAVAVDPATAAILLDKGRRVWLLAVYDEGAVARWRADFAADGPPVHCDRRVGRLITLSVLARDAGALPPLCRQ